MNARERRPIGSTGLNVTALGLGGAALGNLYRPVSDAEAAATISTAWGAGCRLFDTAPLYGHGLSERRMGDVLRSYPRDAFVLATKVGRMLKPVANAPGLDGDYPYKTPMPFDAVFDYSYDAVMRSVEDSLQRLGLSRIDIAFIHDIGRVTHGDDAHPGLMKTAMEGGYKALDALRSAGVVRAIGLGVNEWEVCDEAMNHGRFDCFLLAGRYTLLEQGALDHFLPRCAREGASVLVGGPFNSGILARGAGAADTYNYEPAPSDIVERVRRIETVCGAHGVPLAAAAIQFPLAHPQVASVVSGAARPWEMACNADWMAHPIPSDLWAELKSEGLVAADAPVPDGQGRAGPD